MTDWVRLWHDMPTDPKWRVIARKSGQPLPCVIALFTLMMTAASSADDRGSIEGLSIEDAAAALDMDDDDVAAILREMEGRVVEKGRLSGWERRQPKREDDSAKRVAKHRAEKKRNVTQGNAPEKSREETEDIPPTPLAEQAFAEWNVLAEQKGLAQAVTLTDERKSKINRRIDAVGIDGWRAALTKVGESPFLCGDNDRSWKADLDFVLQAKSFQKLIEGGFAATQRAPPGEDDYLDRVNRRYASS